MTAPFAFAPVDTRLSPAETGYIVSHSGAAVLVATAEFAGTATATITDRVHQAHAFFQHRTNAQNLATAAPWTSPWLPESYGKEFKPGAQATRLSLRRTF